ncbi:cyclin-A3-1-like [Pyrus ussuriensis x Pyrus communis]|uniref:B-like cyclin n=1 Tax=Pyrus ussuriensis x Pyrus communis TaxID=2448454 RepID=A0A5N5FIS6_9ROSA|nr:cyclin-A3-1-like [Pyrus ussuriensis x Pyrus communis]
MDDTVSTNRSSTKRPSSTSPSLQIAAPKRRVVLGELNNSPIQNSDRKKPMRKNNMMKKEMEVQETEIVASSVDQTKSECSSSIYQHLHSLEKLNNLFLLFSFIDRFHRSTCVGWNCIICHPRVEDFCYVTDNTYMVEEMLEMERDVVKFLNSDTGPPTTKNFLRLFTRAALENNKSAGMFEFLSCFLLELSLLDCSCVQFLPSVVAASAIFLSRAWHCNCILVIDHPT